MKKLATAILHFKPTTYITQCSLTCLIFCFTGWSTEVAAQNSQSIGMEYGVILIPKISSSGTKNSNYFIAINSKFDLSKKWSLTTGIKYLKYGTHTYYWPVAGFRQSYDEALVEKTTYGIQNLAFLLDLSYKTKYVNFFIAAQPEKALFGKQQVTHKVLRFSEIQFEHLPQSKLNEYNFSCMAGIGINQNFGDKISFSLKPSVQYFVLPFYKEGGFEEVKLAYNLSLGINFNLQQSEN